MLSFSCCVGSENVGYDAPNELIGKLNESHPVPFRCTGLHLVVRRNLSNLDQTMLALAAVAPTSFTAPFMPKGVIPTEEALPWSSSEISDEAGLKKLATQLNPVVGYW